MLFKILFMIFQILIKKLFIESVSRLPEPRRRWGEFPWKNVRTPSNIKKSLVILRALVDFEGAVDLLDQNEAGQLMGKS